VDSSQLETTIRCEHHLPSKELGVPRLHPAGPCARIRMHKGCGTPRVQGLGRPPLAETTFYFLQQETGHTSGRSHYWLPEGQVTSIRPSVHRLRDAIRLEQKQRRLSAISARTIGALYTYQLLLSAFVSRLLLTGKRHSRVLLYVRIKGLSSIYRPF